MPPIYAILPRLLVTSCLVAVATVTGCRAGGEDLVVVNNQLREQNMNLRDRVTALERRNAELELATKKKASQPGELPAEIQANLPRITAISLNRLSGIADSAGGPVVRAYVKPTDGRGRFTQMTGTLTLSFVRVTAGEDAETVLERAFSPAEVREAYRSSFMGTHYTFELPIAQPIGLSDASWLIVATFDDAVTGETLRAEQALKPAE